MKRALLAAALCALAAACATLPTAAPCVALGPGSELCLLPPAALPAQTSVHVIAFRHDDEEQSFIGQTRIDAAAVHVVTSSLLGPSLFSVDYDGRHIVTQPADGPWHADLLLARMQLALAPKEALAPALHGLTLRQTDTADGYRREFLRDGKAVAEVDVKGRVPVQTIHIDIPPAKISVTLTPLEQAPAP